MLLGRFDALLILDAWNSELLEILVLKSEKRTRGASFAVYEPD